MMRKLLCLAGKDTLVVLTSNVNEVRENLRNLATLLCSQRRVVLFTSLLGHDPRAKVWYCLLLLRILLIYGSWFDVYRYARSPLALFFLNPARPANLIFLAVKFRKHDWMVLLVSLLPKQELLQAQLAVSIQLHSRTIYAGFFIDGCHGHATFIPTVESIWGLVRFRTLWDKHYGSTRIVLELLGTKKLFICSLHRLHVKFDNIIAIEYWLWNFQRRWLLKFSEQCQVFLLHLLLRLICCFGTGLFLGFILTIVNYLLMMLAIAYTR